MLNGRRWLGLALVAVAACMVFGVNANATTPQPVPADIICPPVPCCCEDARVCVIEEVAPVCYTEAGLKAFVTLFRDAAAKGVENATIRAFNATKVAPDCVDCDQPKK